MIGYDIGSVVLYNFPFDDNGGYKIRPCVIVNIKADRIYIASMVTTKPNFHKDRTETITIHKNSPEAEAMGLVFDSLIIPDRITEMAGEQIIKEIGKCPAHILDTLRLILGYD